jgi:hypothetical protein
LLFDAAAASGDDVGYPHILQHRDFVAETQLAAFKPGQLQLIRSGGRTQGVDRAIQIAMFFLEQDEAPANLVGAHCVDHPLFRMVRVEAKFGLLKRNHAAGLPQPFGAARMLIGAFADFAERQLGPSVFYSLSPSRGKGDCRMETGHSSALTAKHAGIEAKIAAEFRRPAPDLTLVARLKKQKLRLKEALSRF